MRKVLLATTALVAMGGVSAASADISIKMSSEFKYSNYSDNTGTTTDKSTYASTTDMVVTATSALDNGMSVKATLDVDEGTTQAGGLSISGDFGTLGFKDLGSEHGAVSTDVTADEGHGATTGYVLPADEAIGKSTVSWTAPAISGFSLSLGLTEGGTGDDTSTYGVGYSIDAGTATVAINWAAESAGNVDDTALGATLTMGDLVIKAASNSTETGTTSDITGTSMGLTYKLSDAMTVQAYTGNTEDSKDAVYKVTDTGVGFSYTITPGLKLSVTHNDYSTVKTGTSKVKGDNTALAIDVSF